ncbi:MAG: DNA primase [Candidatus Buchananbacteria bacterium]
MALSSVDEIKSKLDILEVVQEYIRLNPAGTNFKAPCPFHQEKTPSFMVSTEKQIWHCFGCGEGGDIFSFVMKMENIEFPEALKILANKAGVKLASFDSASTSQRNRLLDVGDLTARFWQKILWESASAKSVLDYLIKERRLTNQTIEEFQLGFAPDSSDLLQNFLKKKGFSESELFLAGLTVKQDRGVGFYDRFRSRVMFPINDLHGNVVGFGGRLWDPTGQSKSSAKYMNTPQTDLYNKSAILFNLDKAKLEIKKLDSVVLVEGYMDVIAAWQAGTKNVVAVSGTALTTEQIKILKRYTNNLIIALDADLAGETAARRGIDLALQQEADVKVIILPFGKDPDECIKTSASAWLKAVQEAKEIMQYYWEKNVVGADLNSPQVKKQIAKTLLAIIAKLGNPLEREHWLKRLAETLNVSENILREILPGAKATVRPKDDKTVKPFQPLVKTRIAILAERALMIAFKFPEYQEYLINNLSPEILLDKFWQELYKSLIIYYTKNRNNNASLASGPLIFDSEAFKQEILANSSYLTKELQTQMTTQVGALLLLAERDLINFSAKEIKEELKQTVKLIKQGFLHFRLQELTGLIQQLENKGESTNQLLQEFNSLTEQLLLLS